MFEQFKIRAACDELGVSPKIARTLVHYHAITKGGTIPELLVLAPGQTAESRLGPYARFLNQDNTIGQQMRDVKRLYLDSPYRSQITEMYEKIKPRVQRMSLREMFSTLTSKNLEQY